MRQISKEQADEIATFINELNEINGVIEAKQEEVNDKIGELNESIQRYNNVLKNADDFATKIVKSMEDYMSDRGEEWLESSASNTYHEWKNSWEEIDLQPLSLVEYMAVDDCEHVQALDDLPLNPE